METEKEECLIIDPNQLSKEVLENLVEEFILREGTDYGHSETTLEDKKKRVFNQLEKNHIKIVYSTLTENCTLLRKNEFSGG